MYGLLYKELILHKKQLLGIMASNVILSAILFIPDSESAITDEMFIIINLMFISIIFLVLGMFQQGIFEFEERKRWQYFISSTPNGIENEIMAKYIFTLLTSVLTVTYCMFVHMAACLFVGSEYSLPNILIILFVPIQLTLRSIEFPFLVRFGSKYGNTFRAFIFTLIVFFIIVYLLFGDLSIFGSLESFINFINTHILSEEGFSDGVIYFIRISPFLSIVMYFLSYKISCRLYLKGGENYDG